MRIHRLTLAAVVGLLGVCGLSAAPADATLGYSNLCSSLQTALCTSFEFDIGVAVDNSKGSSAGDVWVGAGYEYGPPVLVELDAAGNQIAEVGNSDIPEPALPFRTHEAAMSGVAVDPGNGDVYVANYVYGKITSTVTKFDSSGVFQFQITGSETPQGSFFPVALAVDPANGDLFVADADSGMVDKFTSSGVYIEQFSVPAEFHTGLAFGLEGSL